MNRWSKPNGVHNDDVYLDELVDVTDELRAAMGDLDHAIKRLEAALVRHRTLKAAHDQPAR